MKKLRSLAAIALALPLALAACSNGDGGASSSSEGADPAAVVSVRGSEPQNPLVPANTNEAGGGLIIDNIFAGLQYYNEKGEPQLEIAESIESEDNQLWTIKIKPDWKFSDGSAITAQTFVDTWNQAVKQNMLNSYFFESIKGYPEALEAAEAAVESGSVGDVDMSGLTVVDDTTFTVELLQPESDFPLRLGYSAYYPMPESGIGDVETVKAYGENPAVSNGPYTVKEGSWSHNEQIELVPNPEYKGAREVKNGGVLVKFYSTLDAAYNDLLSGNLDVTESVPDSAFGTFAQELGDRAVNQAAGVFQSFTIPASDERFQGEAGLLRKQAISMAINREEITETIFQGSRTPATDFIAPVIPGHNDNLKGKEVLTFNPEKAKELWAQAEAISPWSGSFEIAYNSDGGHQAWVDATANSIKNVLGIDAKGAPYPDFKSLRDEITNRTITKAFRTGWQADYPSPFNFLGPLYGTGGSSNDGDYTNPEFDALLEKALGTSDQAEANKIYDQAQELLLADLPTFPLWYANVTAGSSESVQNVVFDWKSQPILTQITKE